MNTLSHIKTCCNINFVIWDLNGQTTIVQQLLTARTHCLQWRIQDLVMHRRRMPFENIFNSIKLLNIFAKENSSMVVDVWQGSEFDSEHVQDIFL